MSTPELVRDFYEIIWNKGDLNAADAILASGLVFRGSLGAEIQGRAAFLDYVQLVRGALSEYRCDIVECVAEGDRAFAKMQFSGRHTGAFRGFAPTGQQVLWAGAALFRLADGAIAEIWVLGDLTGLDALLTRQAAAAT